MTEDHDVSMVSEVSQPALLAVFGVDAGVLPDGEVVASTIDDWDLVLPALRATGWMMSLRDGSTPGPSALTSLPFGDSFAVWPATRVRVNFFPGPDGVTFDIDLRELVDQPAVDGLVALMRCIGSATGRDVTLSEEGRGAAALRYLAGDDSLLLREHSDTNGEVVTLWRPTGPEEIALVRELGSRRWPPLLPDQLIFYPVLNEEYATQIARDWNVKASGIGYVTKFDVRKSFLDQYEVHQVGGQTILEYWIPAEDLELLNDAIVGDIEETASFT